MTSKFLNVRSFWIVTLTVGTLLTCQNGLDAVFIGSLGGFPGRLSGFVGPRCFSSRIFTLQESVDFFRLCARERFGRAAFLPGNFFDAYFDDVVDFCSRTIGFQQNLCFQTTQIAVVRCFRERINNGVGPWGNWNDCFGRFGGQFSSFCDQVSTECGFGSSWRRSTNTSQTV